MPLDRPLPLPQTLYHHLPWHALKLPTLLRPVYILISIQGLLCVLGLLLALTLWLHNKMTLVLPMKSPLSLASPVPPSPISFLSRPVRGNTASPIPLSPVQPASPAPTIINSVAEYEEACVLPAVHSLICINAPPAPTSELGDYEDLPCLEYLKHQELIYPDNPTKGATSISIDMRGVQKGQEVLQRLKDTLGELRVIMTNQEDLAALEAPLVCIKEQLEAGRTLAEAMDTDAAAGWSALPWVELDKQEAEDLEHPGLPFQINSPHSPNYVSHWIQDGSGGLHVPKYVAFMYLM
jgi:hypothetical protein